jgi:uroporphyrinogen III methyltransferase / synthase
LTLGALRALREADVVLYDALVSAALVTLAPDGAERIYVGKRAGEHALPQREIEALLIARAREGKRVVRLKGGDPFVFGRGADEAQALHKAGVAFTIVPGITSAIAAPAYAGIPLTHREHASSFVVVTGHEDPAKPDSAIDWSRIAGASTIVVLMGMEHLASLAEQLMTHGVGAGTPAAVVQDGTRPSQRCVTAPLAEIARVAEREGIGAPAVLVAGDVVALREELRWFDRRPLFGKRVLVTRPRGRGAQRFAQALLSRGAEPVLAPTIEIGPPDDPAGIAREMPQLDAYAWVVFVSQHGVDAFFRALRERGKDARAMGGLRVAAVGAKTAERLASHGVHADLVSGRFTGDDVAHDLLGCTQPGDAVLVFAAQEGRDVVRSILADAGRKPVAVAAYKTNFVADPAFAQSVASCDIVTFTSGSTVQGFASLLGGNAAAVEAARTKVVACIGPITADEAREIGLRVDIVPDAFTTDDLLVALEAHAAP